MACLYDTVRSCIGLHLFASIMFCQANFCHSCCLKGSFSSLLLTLAFYYLQSFSNFTGSVDSHGTCQCSVSLPDTAFPADRVERLEFTAHILSQKFEKEFSKVSVFFSNMVLIHSQSPRAPLSRERKLSKRVGSRLSTPWTKSRQDSAPHTVEKWETLWPRNFDCSVVSSSLLPFQL